MPAIDNHRKLRTKLTKLINSDTYYNYAKMALQLKQNSDAYSLKVHGVSSQEAYNIAESVFGKKVGYTDTIESFLENIHNLPAYGLTIDETKKKDGKAIKHT